KMTETAIDWGSIGKDGDYGAGRLDAYGAVAAASTPAPGELTTPPTGIPGYQRIQSSLAGAAQSRTFEITPEGAYPLAIGLTVGTANSDFDMYLLDSTGHQVAKAETPYRQDALHVTSP